jgi:phosphate:Na+ symporter
MEEVIDSLVAAIKGRHIDRVTHKACDVYSGILFEDIVSNIERISDLCSDLGIFVLARSNPRILGHEHEYVHNLHHSNNQRYAKSFHDYYDRYLNRLGPNILEPVPASPESGQKAPISSAKKSDKHVSAVTEEKKAEGKKPEGKSSEGKRPEGKKSEGARPEGKKPEVKKSEGTRTEGKKSEAKKSEGARPEGKKTQGTRSEGKKRTEGKKEESSASVPVQNMDAE